MTLNIGIGIGIPEFSPLGAAGADVLAPATLYMDFQADVARVNGVWSSARSQLTTTRASQGASDTSDGWWGQISANLPRMSDRGLLTEEARTNFIPNNSMTGAVVGTPGTLPTTWVVDSFVVDTGVKHAVVGKGNIKGIEYIDLRLYGTHTAPLPEDQWYEVNMVPVQSTIVGAPNEWWCGSFFLSVVGGNAANLDSYSGIGVAFNDGVNYLGDLLPAVSFTELNSTFNRHIMSGQAPAGTAGILPYIYIYAVDPSLPIDITIRIGWPQVEKAGYPTSPIRTVNGPVTRATDQTLVKNLASWYSQTGGTVFLDFWVDYKTEYGMGGAEWTEVMVLWGAAMSGVEWGLGHDNTVWFYANPPAAPTYAVNGATFDIMTDNMAVKLAACMVLNDANAYVNGVQMDQGLPDTTVSPVPSPMVEMWLNYDAETAGNCYLRRLAYWPTRLTNTQLQAITG